MTGTDGVPPKNGVKIRIPFISRIMKRGVFHIPKDARHFGDLEDGDILEIEILGITKAHEH